MIERLSEAAIRLFSAVASMIGDNAASSTGSTSTAIINARSSTASRPLDLLHGFATSTISSSPSTSQTSTNPTLPFETELQPWSYRRASERPELDAVRRKRKEQRDKKARRASEAWRNFWT